MNERSHPISVRAVLRMVAWCCGWWSGVLRIVVWVLLRFVVRVANSAYAALMARASFSAPDYILIDGNRCPGDLSVPARCAMPRPPSLLGRCSNPPTTVPCDMSVTGDGTSLMRN